MPDWEASALRIDTCTLSPFCKFVKDRSGTFSSTVSPLCILSFTVLRCWSTSATVAGIASCAPIAPVCEDGIPVVDVPAGPIPLVPVPICPVDAGLSLGAEPEDPAPAPVREALREHHGRQSEDDGNSEHDGFTKVPQHISLLLIQYKLLCNFLACTPRSAVLHCPQSAHNASQEISLLQGSNSYATCTGTVACSPAGAELWMAGRDTTRKRRGTYRCRPMRLLLSQYGIPPSLTSLEMKNVMLHCISHIQAPRVCHQTLWKIALAL